MPAEESPHSETEPSADDIRDAACGAYTALVGRTEQSPAHAGDPAALPRDVRRWLGERHLLDDGRRQVSSPEHALHDLLAEHRERLGRSWDELHRGLEAFDDVLRLLPGVRHAGRETVEAEFFTDRTRLRQRMDDLDALCRDELLGLRSTFPAQEVLVDGLDTDLRMLGRGVDLRLLVSARATRRAGAGRYLSALVEHGARIRVAETVPLHLNVVDRAVTVLALGPTEKGAGALGSGSVASGTAASRGSSSGDVILHSARLAECFTQVFHHHWSVGRPWRAGRPGSGGSAEEWSLREREILALLATGAKDEAIARRLGCSERTLRRLLTALIAKLGAESRFAAGARAAGLGLLDPPGDAPRESS
ncbi:helix-turn-helix transcriptional regulator [Streptomyces peucetius]|uniref:Helix-turn-helix transcriptional regulator n=1 Tax=Streptomyces peucetius TaxID=1950 RepID=A0ABY6I694_STRPE|nr:helix-turn-helix transcriptional regulator [Streptomyces peucetius]UYQ62521.1 helix-turn-helix transcriptional regulator [Streptomyces peucetius]